MRRSLRALAATLAVSGTLGLATAVAAAPAPAVRTVAGTGGAGSLSAPSGIALDSAGDLFIADTDHCRVVLVPKHAGTLYGLRVEAGHEVSLAGGSCGVKGSLGSPTGVAVDQRGDVYVAEASDQRVQMIRPGGHAPITVVGTGVAGSSADGQPGTQSQLNHPSGVAVDRAGSLYIADTANCRVRVMPAADGTYFGRTMLAQHLYTIAGTGVCGSAQRSGTAAAAQLWNPLAVTLDRQGDLFIADSGDQSILEVPVQNGTDYGSTIAAGGIGTVVGQGSNGPYFGDGLPANGDTAELNDPEGIAVNAAGTLFMTDGSQHCIRVVPDATATVFGRAMQAGDLYTLAGALPVANSTGLGNGTRWVLTHMGVPVGLAVSASDSVLYSDRGTHAVSEIG